MQLFDSHFHIINDQYPLQTNHGFLPNNFLVEDYLRAMQHEHLLGGVVVSGSFHGPDLTYIEPTLKQLGSAYVAVIQAPSTIDEKAIANLDSAGVRGIRFNLVRDNNFSTKEIYELARKVYATAGWHTEFYADSNCLENLRAGLSRLPSLGIDHLGLSQAGLNNVIYLAAKGAKVKASGFGRVDFDTGPVLQKIYAANPDALMFGSDLPSTRAPRKYSAQDIRIIEDLFSPDAAKKILYKNAQKFYRVNL